MISDAILLEGKLLDEGVQDKVPRAVVVVVCLDQPEDLLLSLEKLRGHVWRREPSQEKLLIILIYRKKVISLQIP